MKTECTLRSPWPKDFIVLPKRLQNQNRKKGHNILYMKWTEVEKKNGNTLVAKINGVDKK